MGFFRRGKKDKGQTPPGASASPLGGRSDVMQALTRPGFVQSQMGTADRTRKLDQRGVEMPATLRSLAVGEPTPMFGGVPVDLELTIQPPGGTPYDLSIHQVFVEATVKTLAPGQQVTVKVDPEDPQTAMLSGG